MHIRLRENKLLLSMKSNCCVITSCQHESEREQQSEVNGLEHTVRENTVCTPSGLNNHIMYVHRIKMDICHQQQIRQRDFFKWHQQESIYCNVPTPPERSNPGKCFLYKQFCTNYQQYFCRHLRIILRFRSFLWPTETVGKADTNYQQCWII